MHIMTKAQVLVAAAKDFAQNTVTMKADTHPEEFRCYVISKQGMGQYWGITLEDMHNEAP